MSEPSAVASAKEIMVHDHRKVSKSGQGEGKQNPNQACDRKNNRFNIMVEVGLLFNSVGIFIVWQLESCVAFFELIPWFSASFF